MACVLSAAIGKSVAEWPSSSSLPGEEEKKTGLGLGLDQSLVPSRGLAPICAYGVNAYVFIAGKSVEA